MTLIQIIVLSLIQGLTEFLPISSSAHLILPSKLLGWDDQGLAFDVACHVGTLLAVVLYYRQRLTQATVDFFVSLKTHEQTENSRLCWYIIFSTIPVCLFGMLLDDFIEDYVRDFAVLVIAGTTIIFGLLLWFSDIYANKQNKNLTIATMGLKIALIVGISQTLALIPGTSRSGITMTVALFLGLSRKDAADYSFLLSIPLILAAGSYSTLKVITKSVPIDYVAMILGILLSFISAYIVIKLFLRFITNIGLWPFVVYRLILGILLLVFALSTLNA